MKAAAWVCIVLGAFLCAAMLIEAVTDSGRFRWGFIVGGAIMLTQGIWFLRLQSRRRVNPQPTPRGLP